MPPKKRKSVAKTNARQVPVGRSQRVSLQKSAALAQSARQAWERHQYDRTISLYKEALRRNPTSFELLVDLARAYGLRYRLAEAEDLLDRAVRLHPRSAKVYILVARSYSMIGRPLQAVEHFVRALDFGPNESDKAAILAELATLHEQGHHLTEARDAIDSALALMPQNAPAIYRQALVRIRQGEVTEGRAQLERLAATPQTPPQVCSDAWYELARVHDLEGDFEAAFRLLEAAKRLLEPQAARFKKEREFLERRHELMFERLTPEYFQRWHNAGRADEPRSMALLTGHPRSGTTLLEQVLDGHTQVVSADEYLVMGEFVFKPLAAREAEHMPTPAGLDRVSSDVLARLRADYWAKTESMLGQPIGPRLLLDKNPSLSYLLPAICRVFPEVKLLFALRDPRDVVLSCYLQRMPINAISSNYLTLEATAEKYADAMRYWLQLRPQLACAWQEVRYEDTVADLPRQAQRTLEFLGLPWEANVVNFHERAQMKRVRSPTYQAVTQEVYSHAVGRWRNYTKYLEPVLGTLQPYVEAFGYE